MSSLAIRFGCVLIDPPWNESGAGKRKRGADRHDDLLKTEEVLPVVITSGVFLPADGRALGSTSGSRPSRFCSACEARGCDSKETGPTEGTSRRCRTPTVSWDPTAARSTAPSRPSSMSSSKLGAQGRDSAGFAMAAKEANGTDTSTSDFSTRSPRRREKQGSTRPPEGVVDGASWSQCGKDLPSPLRHFQVQTPSSWKSRERSTPRSSSASAPNTTRTPTGVSSSSWRNSRQNG